MFRGIAVEQIRATIDSTTIAVEKIMYVTIGVAAGEIKSYCHAQRGAVAVTSGRSVNVTRPAVGLDRGCWCGARGLFPGFTLGRRLKLM